MAHVGWLLVLVLISMAFGWFIRYDEANLLAGLKVDAAKYHVVLTQAETGTEADVRSALVEVKAWLYSIFHNDLKL